MYPPDSELVFQLRPPTTSAALLSMLHTSRETFQVQIGRGITQLTRSFIFISFFVNGVGSQLTRLFNGCAKFIDFTD